MNISEAHDAQVLLDFVTRLTVWEYVPDPAGPTMDGAPEPLNESRLLGAIERLAERSHKALGAGMGAAEAGAAARAAGIGGPS